MIQIGRFDLTRRVGPWIVIKLLQLTAQSFLMIATDKTLTSHDVYFDFQSNSRWNMQINFDLLIVYTLRNREKGIIFLFDQKESVCFN